MIISLNELINWLHISPLELCIHIVGIIWSLIAAVLWDEEILGLLLKSNERFIIFWWIFLPLWCADVLVLYFNLVVFFRRIHYHKVVRQSLRYYGFRPDYLPASPWSSIVLDTTYKLLFNICIFAFKLVLFQRFVYLEQSNLTYSTVFSPVICVMQLILLSVCMKTCGNRI
ncbi:unnamed protein product [Trichobilharzia szidati]|nr:unnamed protein product [Trichobilharzia szidati]